MTTRALRWLSLVCVGALAALAQAMLATQPVKNEESEALGAPGRPYLVYDADASRDREREARGASARDPFRDDPPEEQNAVEADDAPAELPPLVRGAEMRR